MLPPPPLSPKSPFHSLRDPNWKQAMCDEYKAPTHNNSWVLVPRPLNVNIFHSMWFRVVKPATIRTVLSLAVSRQWPIHQLDVKNAFLHGHLTETAYMHQPPGFIDSAHFDYVCLLKKSLYGLKHAPELGFNDFLAMGKDTAYLLLYVDDIILIASSTSLLQRIISLLHAEFAMTDLGPLNYFLDISATHTTSGIFLSQTKYATEILEQAHMLNCNPCRTPINTEKKLGPEGSSVTGPTLYRSLVGSLYDNLLTWSSQRQDMLSRSSAEAEYLGVANVVAKTSWIRNLLRELHTPLFTATLVHCDNAPRQWNAKLTSTLIENGLSQIFLKYKFTIKDLGKLKYFFSIEIVDTGKGICLNQRKYVLDLLSDYGMLACKPAKTPLPSKLVISYEATEKDHVLDNITDYQKLMGKLIYLTNTRPDISYDVHCLSQFMHSPLKSHLKTAFQILRYLKGCPGLGIHIVKESANPVFHKRTKHLEIDLHFVREKILKGFVETVKVDSANQIANILTKGLDTFQHKDLVENIVKVTLGSRLNFFKDGGLIVSSGISSISPVNSDHNDDIQDPDPVTRISKLDISDPLHLHHNNSTALTVVSIKLKRTENYQVWSCAMMLALEGKNKIGLFDGSCKRSNTDEVLGKQWDRVNAIILG
ncbi:ribonuclease H-like domain-containing protein [Tanacetum coccineum]